MSKKFWLMILIIAILAGILFWHFQGRFSNISPSESSEEKIKKNKDFKTIELEKPPFIK